MFLGKVWKKGTETQTAEGLGFLSLFAFVGGLPL